MERDSSQPHNNNVFRDDDTNNLYNSYMDFIRTSNSAVRTALDMLYNQQIAFNQIMNVTTPLNVNYVHSFPQEQPVTSFSIPIFSQNRRNTMRDVNPTPTTFFSNRPNLAQYFTEFQNMQRQSEIPSADERVAAIEYITFGEIEEALNTTCPISHRDFNADDTVIRLRECRHIFDASSILQWFTRNSLCPLCRNDIRTPAEPEINTPTSNPLPFAQQLATMISEQLSADRDFSGNISIELAIPGRSLEE